MSENKVIREDEYGVFVDQKSNNSILACTPCNYNKTNINTEPCLSCDCQGYYLTEQEEKEYYSAKRVQIMTTLTTIQTELIEVCGERKLIKIIIYK